MFQIAEDQTIPWLAMVVIIVLIHRVMGYFSERQRLHIFRDLIKATQFGNTILRYTDGQRAITSVPVPRPKDDHPPGSVLQMRPNGQPERRRNTRRHSDARVRGTPEPGRQADTRTDRHGKDPSATP